MSLVDSRTYIADGGYIQKGAEVNIYESDLTKEVQDLLPSRWYRDEKIFQLERRAIFSKCWHIASFIARFQKPGDYVTLDMFGWPFFIIRDKGGNINAFHNICRHRGHPVTLKESGSTTVLACRFHNWSYLPTGSLHKAPEFMNLPNFDPAEHSLFRVHTHVTAQGFIFVNFDSSPTPLISFTDQFGDDFDPNPTSATGKIIGDEYALLEPPSEWAYDHTFESAPSGTAFNWKTFVDGFSECYHCGPAHPTTLGKDFDLKAFYLRLGFGAGRGYLPPLRQDLGLSEAVITSLYPLGSIIFSDKMLLIARWDARGACDTSYQNETYRRVGMQKGSVEYEKWMAEDGDVGYSRIVEREDVVLAMAAQKGFNNGVLGKGRLHPKEEHGNVWFRNKVRKALEEHLELEVKEKKMIDHSISRDQAAFGEEDKVCKLMGPEIEW